MPWTVFKKLLLFNIIAILAISNNYTSAATNHRKRYIQRNNNNNNNISNNNHNNSNSNLSSIEPINRDYNVNKNNLNVNINNSESVSIKNAPKNIQEMLREDKEIDDKDTAKWDSLLPSSTGNGKEKKPNRDEDDDKKTLAQQVKEGKYGLIQNELSSKKLKRPGVISYSSNPDIPRDNSKNFGGLDNEEIWLAENHLLVIKGGDFGDDSDAGVKNTDLHDWSPIDDYQAPKRQVRIPSNPKIPPPFPIQLTDGGPIKIIGRNSTSDSSDDNESSAQWIIPDGLVPFNGTYFIQNESTNDTTTNDDDDGRKTTTKSSPTFAGIIGPFFPALPPGAIFVPPPTSFNQTDYDEDDQSIYYPPVYSFKYQQDNSTVVPPGPLVPGIILPPPPDFFAPLDDNNNSNNNITNETNKINKNKCFKCTESTTVRPNKLNNLNITTETQSKQIKLKEKIDTESPVNKNKLDNYISIKMTTPSAVTYKNKVNISRTTEKSKTSASVSIKKKIRPIVAYYSTTPYYNKKSSETTSRSHNKPRETTPTQITSTEKLNGNLKASYYFYEEDNEVTTPLPINYQDNEARLSYYKLVVEELPPKSIYRKLPPTTPLPLSSYRVSTATPSNYYQVEITPSQQTLQDYQTIEPSVQSFKQQVQLQREQQKQQKQYRQQQQQQYQHNKIVNTRLQGQRILKSQLETDSFYNKKLSSSSPTSIYNFNPLITSTTSRPREFLTSTTIKYNNNNNNNNNKIRPKPIYQYSFEAVNYPHDPVIIYPNNNNNNNNDEKSFYNKWQEDKEQSDSNNEEKPMYDKWKIKKEETDNEDNKSYYNKWELKDTTDYLTDYSSNNNERLKNNDKDKLYNYISTTQSPLSLRHEEETTSDPKSIYYTKHEDQYLDDVTKEYFTNFGRKIKYRLPSTTPIYSSLSTVAYESVTARPRYQLKEEGRDKNYYEKQEIKENNEYYDNIYSLKNDINVNYQRPLPTINPDAEFIDDYDGSLPAPTIRTVVNKNQRVKSAKQYHYQSNHPSLLPINYNNNNNNNDYHQRVPNSFISLSGNHQQYYQQSRIKNPQNPISLAGDIDVNYNNPPPINPEAEFININHPHSHSNSNLNLNSNQRQNGGLRDEPRSYFTYRLPGDDGHVYFFTPHVINRQRQENYGGTRLRGFRSTEQKRN